MCAAPGNKTSHLAMLMGDQVGDYTVKISMFVSFIDMEFRYEA
jgi:16S rRNA C967 or C1407 C5-methylase (RsmB/RsmF family)